MALKTKVLKNYVDIYIAKGKTRSREKLNRKNGIRECQRQGIGQWESTYQHQWVSKIRIF